MHVLRLHWDSYRIHTLKTNKGILFIIIRYLTSIIFVCMFGTDFIQK